MSNSIALIGNAQSLFSRSYGAEIESHGTVARMNRAAVLVTKPFATVSHGMRTDAWFCWRYKEYESLTFQRPIFVMQMAFWEHEEDPSVQLYQEEAFSLLQDELGAVPSTGLMVLDYLDRYTNATVSVYGFDWKATPTFTDPKRKTDKMLNGSGQLHDFSREKEYTHKRFFPATRFNFRF